MSRLCIGWPELALKTAEPPYRTSHVIVCLSFYTFLILSNYCCIFKGTCLFPDWIGSLRLHEVYGYDSCTMSRELLKAPLLLLHANRRVQDFVYWYSNFVGISVRKSYLAA